MRRGVPRLAAWIDDRLNPIVVKELRQAVQGRFVAAVLNVLLLVQLGVVAVFLLTNGVETVDVISSQGRGGQVFGFIFAFLLFTSIVVVPIYAAVRLQVERANESLSLLFISTLAPRRIVAGKVTANLLLVVMLFAACLPFVSFTYFLRGVDLPSILVVLGVGLVISAVCLQAAILVACVPGGRFFKVLLGAAGTVVLLSAFSSALGYCAVLQRRGVGSLLGRGDFWLGASTFLAVAAFAAGLGFLLSVAFVSPPMANRARPVRLFLTAGWLASGAAVAVRTAWLGGSELPEAWAATWVGVAAATLAVAISSRDRMSARVACEVPRTAARRALAFCFWSGSANGVAWALALALATLAVGLLLDALYAAGSLPLPLDELAAFTAYCFAYALTALLLHRRFLAHRLAHGYTWVVAFVLVTLGTAVPVVVGFLASPEEFSRHSGEWRWWFLNPVAASVSRLREPALRFSLLWAAIVAALALPWFVVQLRAFGRAGRAPRLE